MKFQVLASGSKGNLTYIETNDAKILLDVGISAKEIALRSDIKLDEIDAIFITHEHSDHIKGLLSLLKKTSATLYIKKESFDRAFVNTTNKYVGKNVIFIDENKQYNVKDLKILTLPLSHDSAFCMGYIFVSNNKSLGYFTDTGLLPVSYIPLLQKLDSLIIEANHDIELLTSSSRPWILKQRILSPKGHMSNIICGQVLDQVLKTKKLDKVVLAHLSEECNTLELAVDTVIGEIKGDYLPKIYVAMQRESLPLLEV